MDVVLVSRFDVENCLTNTELLNVREGHGMDFGRPSSTRDRVRPTRYGMRG